MQVWLTFTELGEMLGCDSIGARDHVYGNAWERRRCSDGVTRALLPPDSARDFLLRYLATQSVLVVPTRPAPAEAIDLGPAVPAEPIGVHGRAPNGYDEVTAMMSSVTRSLSSLCAVPCNG